MWEAIGGWWLLVAGEVKGWSNSDCRQSHGTAGHSGIPFGGVSRGIHPQIYFINCASLELRSRRWEYASAVKLLFATITSELKSTGCGM